MNLAEPNATTMTRHRLQNTFKSSATTLSLLRSNTGQKMKFSIKDFFCKFHQISPDLVTFTEETFIGKFHFLCSLIRENEVQKKKPNLTIWPMLPFYSPWKTPEFQRFSDTFKVHKMGTLARNRLNLPARKSWILT